TGGIDWQGRPFRKPCSVEKGKVKPLWFGIQVPEGSQPDTYEGSIQLVLNDGEEKVLHLKLGVVAQKLLDSGDSEPWRHSRLRWLDSQLAADDELVSPFTPVRVEGNRVSCLGRQVLVGQDGMPQGIQSFFAPEMTVLSDHARELLSSPIRFVVEDSQHRVLSWSIKEFQFTRQTEGAAAWRSLAIAEDLQLEVQAQMEFDGNNEFNLHLRAAQTTRVSDIRLEVPLHRDVARYMMGMNVLGGIRPKELRWKWNQKRNQDSAWVGDVNAGVQLTLKAENYERPLNTNFYLLKPLNMPISWYNDGKGGCNFLEADSQTFMVRAYSGPREIEAGRSLHFNFRLMLTPFKLLDTQGQWNSRYYHAFKPVSEVLESGANIVNVHHANSINPFINYPFLHCEEMKAYIDEAHQKGLKVKIYYTVRELSNHASELFALRSLDDEIFSRGSGGGSSWLQEHLGSNYIAAWFVPELEDAAIITSGESRWHNYYVEGVNWLAKNIGIDGLYIDDVAFDRTIMKRVRKVLDHSRPGALIDLHSANQFNARDGFANSANLYLEHFPYLNRLWFGEYFDYNARPDFWLIEMSGIPFGLMGEMLQDGGNPWRGMVYGMTGRLPWAGDPRPLWKVWDEFGINQSRMIGYWVPNCPVKSSHPYILATAYVRNDKTLVAVASWAKDEVRCHLAFDWKTLRLEASKCRIKAPAIAGFQEAASYAPEEEIIVPPGRGWLLILSDR
ncbi:MAG TPA: glycoside hydrolase domain-containing protein, partial [Terriglobia bacterium]|nr:glycoside hydrolase domain-containing protein [Terriglobia bacterium]